MSPAPRMLVLMCTHNGERFLQAQLDSLAAQTLLPSALVVHDWNSSDGTRALLQRFASSQAARIQVHLQWQDTAPGAARSFLHALSALRTSAIEFDAVLFCDQDDIWNPVKIARFAQAWRARPHVDLMYCDVELIDAAGRRRKPSYLGPKGAFARQPDFGAEAVLFINVIPGMAMGLSRRLLDRAAVAWVAPDWVMHDWALCCVAHLLKLPVHFIDEALVSYRQHDRNLQGATVGPACTCWRLRQAQDHVARVQAQYRQVLALAGRLGVSPIPSPAGRWEVLRSVLNSRTLRLGATCKVAVGFAVLWRG